MVNDGIPLSIGSLQTYDLLSSGAKTRSVQDEQTVQTTGADQDPD